MDQNNLYDESISTVYDYMNALVKLKRNKLNLYFNKTCKRRKLVPKYIHICIKNKSQQAKQAKRVGEKTWLNNIIQQLYTKINSITMKLYNLHLLIAERFEYVEYVSILDEVNKRSEQRVKTKRKAMKTKLRKLQAMANSSSNNSDNNNMNDRKVQHKFYARTVNLTNIQFDTQETALLDKGLKHNITPNDSIREQNKHLLSVENSILKTDIEDQQNIRTILSEELTRNARKHNNKKARNTDLKTIKSINTKIIENGGMITKADKGNTTVIAYEVEYNKKIEEYIHGNNIQKLGTDPTNEYQKQIKGVINNSRHLLTQKEIRWNKLIKPSAPAIRGLFKIHKIDNPIRPVINFTTAPAYKIARHVNRILTENIKFSKDYSVRNNIELVNKVESVKIPYNAKLVSFDITNMYSNIPVEDTIHITKELLIESKLEKTKINEIIELLETITRQNYFKFKDNYYTQEDGLPMGSPLSGTLANIYLNNFEDKHIMNSMNKYKDNIVYWHRYVDDILLAFNGTQRQLSNLHNYLNNIHEKIKFTIEVEDNKKINFLDLQIINENGKHVFKIHRKPTQTDHTIHSTSNHPYKHKMAAYYHLTNRLNSIPMNDEDYLQELNTIKYIATKNGFNTKIIDRLNKNLKTKQQNKYWTTLNDENDKNTKYVTIEYNKITSNLIQKVLHRHGYKTAYRTVNKLTHSINGTNNGVVETGIYKLTCEECEAFYIGQTGRSFKTRFQEHIKDIGKPVVNSNYAEHLTKNKHSYKDYETNLKILHKCRKGPMMNRIEELEIYKNKANTNLLNDKINTKTNQIYDTIIKNNSLNS